MRHAAQCVALAIVVGFGMAVSVLRAEGVGNGRLVAARNATEPAAAQSDTSRQGESWRYRRHGGLWWYWLPNEKWVYWTGNRWTAYDAQRYSEFRAARPQRSSSYPADQGNWGPVRYDRFGQPQYPYSQRKSGLRQLGPVPALGGVRSLPGWGGER